MPKIAGCLPDPRKEELAKIAHEFEIDAKVKAFGYNDVSTAEWLWNKYVGHPRDPKKPISPTDLKKYKLGLAEFRDTIGKQESAFGRLFKIPKALMRKLPESSYFIEEMSNATSFRQKHLKESSVELKAITDGLYDMILNGDYYGGVPWSKSEFEKYREMESILEQAKTPEERHAALVDVTKMVGVRDGNNNPVGGKILWRFNDLITFRKQPQGEVENKIVENWSVLRKRSANLLLNGIEQSKAIIKTYHDPTLKKNMLGALDKLQAAAERIHFQQGIDAQKTDRPDQFFDLSKTEMKVYDSETGTVKPYRMIDEHGKRVIPRELTKYAPEYVIELANVVREITDYASNSSDPKWQGATPEQMRVKIDKNIDLGRMINRLKSRTDVENGKFYSLDPIYYLNKYIQDVAHFNYVTRINLAYKKAADKMWDITRTHRAGTELGDYAQQMVDMITEIRDSGLNNYEGTIPEMDEVVRLINGMEYVSKLGWSIRGGLRNRSQMLFDWIRYGTKAYTVSRNFYNASNDNIRMADEQLSRFGFFFGEKATAASTAVATAGSIQEVAPPGTIMTQEGGLRRETPSAVSKIATGVSEFASKGTIGGVKVAPAATGPLQIAENANRKGTFKKAFAMTYTLMDRNRAYHAEKWMEQTKSKEPPDRKVLDEHMAHMAGNAAMKAVGDLHFHYDNWAKAKALQTRGNPVGALVGQFQTYRFGLWDLQWQLLKDAKRGVGAGKYGLFETDAAGKVTRIMPEIQAAMRYLSLYSLIVPAASAFGPFGINYGNLIQNETYDTLQRYFEFYTADEEDPAQLEDKYGQFFGKSALAGSLGPFMSDVLTMVDMFDVYGGPGVTPEELQDTMKMRYDPDDPDWWYKVARVANIQGSRTGWHTIPALLQGQLERAFRVETGLYKPKHLYDWMRDSDDAYFKQRKDWLYNNPYSPISWAYTGERMFGVGPALPKIGKKKKRRKNQAAMTVLEGMLAGKY